MFNRSYQTPADAGTASARFFAQPVHFLKHHPIRAPITNAPSGQQNFVMLEPESSSATRTKTVWKSTPWQRTETRNTVGYEIRGAGQLGGAANALSSQSLPWGAHFIRMDDGVAQTAPHVLDGSGPNIMVTPELTGCSFVVEAVGPGQVQVAHVRPVGAHNHSTLPGALQAQYPDAEVYGDVGGADNYDTGRNEVVTIVGVRRRDGWTIYAQRRRRYDGAAVLGVRELYPNPRNL